jgi:hypothetical protein
MQDWVDYIRTYAHMYKAARDAGRCYPGPQDAVGTVLGLLK